MINNLKLLFIFLLLDLFLLLLANMFLGFYGLVFMFFVCFVINYMVYFKSYKMILSFYNATLIKDDNLYNITKDLAIKANIACPKLYLIDINHANAFASGISKNNSIIAISKNLFEILDKKELEAVIAHEIMHIKNKDMLIASIIAVFASSIIYISNIGKIAFIFKRKQKTSFFYSLFLLVLAPISSLLIQASISKSREFLADKGSKKLTGDGAFLSNALIKINNFNLKNKNNYLKPETAHMFIYNVFKSKDIINLFNTHPSIETRVNKLLYEY